MAMITAFMRRYPGQSALLVLVLLGGAVADGLGLGALLPVLNLLLSKDETRPTEGLEADVYAFFESIGIPLELGWLLGLIVLSVFLKSAFVLFAETRIGFIGAEVTTQLRMRLLRAVMTSRWSYFVHQSPGKLANSMATEAWRASLAYLYGLRVIALAVECLVYAWFAITQSWQVTLAAVVMGAVIFAFTHRFVRISKRAGKQQTKWYRSLLVTLTNTLQSVKTFKAMGRDGLAEDVLQFETDRIRGALRGEVFGNAALEAIQEPIYATVAALGIFGALVILQVPLATVMFMVVVLLRLVRQLGRVQKQYQRLATCESAYWAIHETIEEAEAQHEARGGEGEPTLEKGIRLAHVQFAYEGEQLFGDLDMRIEANQITCLIGSSGAGKTTTIDLIVGLHAPTAGEVLIDGVPLGSLDMRKWRRCIGYVPQENLLLHDTILHNVTLGEPSLTSTDAERALKAAGAWTFVSALDQGIQEKVGERGTRLSGGERQRIMIARALAHRPKLLILDEATSALDPNTERELCATLVALRGELTILAISHQSGIVNVADRVYRLQGGVAELHAPPLTRAAP